MRNGLPHELRVCAHWRECYGRDSRRSTKGQGTKAKPSTLAPFNSIRFCPHAYVVANKVKGGVRLSLGKHGAIFSGCLDQKVISDGTGRANKDIRWTNIGNCARVGPLFDVSGRIRFPSPTPPFSSPDQNAVARRFIAASCTPPWLASGWGCRGQRLSRG